MKYARYSTVIIGSGIAGLYAALKTEQQVNLADGLLLITKSKLGESNSRYAQGGMVGVMKENKKDSTQAHISDTIKAGAGLSEFNTVKFISENSDAVVKDLLKFGVEFDRDENGQFTYTLEAAHSVNRVLHAGGDATGRAIEQALCEQIKKNSNIDVYEKTIAVELLVSNDTCKGVIVFNEVTEEYETIYSSCIILATGGVGQLYKYTTNPSGATGDGLALAYNAGAVLQDMEFVQFHPTALAIDSGECRFLISEAVRGEGAKLVDADGKEFMHKYHPLKELAPRDVVTRANFNERNVYLNAACINKTLLAKRFPNISEKCAQHGIDISKDFIPVAPAAHYFMGGIKTNLHGETAVKGLFAIGEAASTGLHGGNRLASNSLLECVVCAYSVAQYLKSDELKAPKQIDEEIKSAIDKYSDESVFLVEIEVNKDELRELMWEHVGILRSEKSLLTAKEELERLRRGFPRSAKCLNRGEYEYKNMLETAGLIIDSALLRKESRGAHCRTDYPQTNEECIHSHTSLAPTWEREQFCASIASARNAGEG
ncbi:MAG: L-aspartate oxidase [Heliobacteriaceae bacterium]|jgi:L-aspartate oxidase|nr:L-aspartate oxidase [Heliobacteriaceae bacterium]